MNKIALLFPGQGMDFVGMESDLIGIGKNLCKQYEVAIRTFEEANDVLKINMLKFVFEENILSLKKTDCYNAIIFVISMILFRIYVHDIGIKPHYLMGHSSGEFVALACSGAIKFQDALRISDWATKYMKKIIKPDIGTMALLSGKDKNFVEEECKRSSFGKKFVIISNYNSNKQFLISGHCENVKIVCDNIKKKGGIAIYLGINMAFHSPLMQEVADGSEEMLDKIIPGDFQYPVISNVTASPYPSKDDIKTYLMRHITSPVLWDASTDYLIGQNVGITLEMGPQTALRNLMRDKAPFISSFSYNRKDCEKLLETIGFENRSKIIERLFAINIKNNEDEVESTEKLISITGLTEENYQNDIIKQVAQIWARGLYLKSIDINENLNELGSDSMSIVRLLSEMDKQYPGLIVISDLFSYSTVKEIASYIEKKMRKKRNQDDFNSKENEMNDILHKLAEGELSPGEAKSILNR